MSRARTADVLDTARGVRAMVGVIAIMMFLTVLVAALGVATRNAAASLDSRLAGRLTVRLIADDAGAERVLVALRGIGEVNRAKPVPRAEVAALLEPWLGSDIDAADLPIPVLIDVDLTTTAPAAAERIAAMIHDVAPDAQVDRHSTWMAPVLGVLRSITALAAALVALMAGATAAVVVLAARAGLDAHRRTIEVMHGLGATDVQIARLFQRRIARDAALGGMFGAAAGLAVVVFLGSRIAALEAVSLGGVGLGATGWLTLAALPFGFVLLAALAARLAVTRALRRTL